MHIVTHENWWCSENLKNLLLLLERNQIKTTLHNTQRKIYLMNWLIAWNASSNQHTHHIHMCNVFVIWCYCSTLLFSLFNINSAWLRWFVRWVVNINIHKLNCSFDFENNNRKLTSFSQFNKPKYGYWIKSCCFLSSENVFLFLSSNCYPIDRNKVEEKKP